MAGEWMMSELGDLTINFDGKRKPVKESDRRPGSYPYYGASGVVDHVDGFIFDGDYLLIAEDGENLRTRQTPIAFMAKGRFWVNNHAHIVTGNDKADTRFLMYALQNADISGYLTGAVMPKLTQGNLNRIEISHPCVTEQRAIAHILGTLDDKIELNRRRNQTLEAMARALFKDWFVDFGPVRAKGRGEPPCSPLSGQAQGPAPTTPYLPADLWQLFPDRLDDEGKPEGWAMQPLSELLTIIGGGTPKTSVQEYWDGDIPWFSVVDTPSASDVFVVSTEKTITNQGLAESSARLIPKGTTIISARGTVGNLAIAGREMTFNQSCYGLRGTGNAGDYFVYLTAQHMVDQLKSMAHGSVFSTITRQTFEAIQRPVPPSGVLGAFEGLVEGWFDAILSNVEESRTLAQLRDTMLPKLISGELRMQDAELFIERAD